MTFTFTNYAGMAPRHSPLNDMVGKVLGGYNDVTKAQYLKPQMEADIFNKQISPLSMLASSPYFSSLHPEQQQQIAGYISQMLNKQGMGGQNGQNSGGMNPMVQQGAMGGQNQMGQQQQQGSPQGGNDNLIPGNAGEHFTNKFTQSPYSPGTAHRGSNGETIYSPTGSNVQKGIDVLTESKGLKKIWDDFSNIAPSIGGAGGFKRDLSNVASGIEKTGLPYTQRISEALGGAKLSNEAASAQAMQAQMAPALRALGFSNDEIKSMLQFYPGETAANIKERLKNTWPIIERKIEQHQKNLKQGVNINQSNMSQENEPQSYDQNMAQNAQGQYKEAPEGTIGLFRNGKMYYIPQNEVNEALQAGFSYE